MTKAPTRYEIKGMALSVALAVAWVYALGHWFASHILYEHEGQWSFWPFVLATGFTFVVWAVARADRKKDGRP
jgi:membrane protein DedA with SNARE-associated domain